MEALRLHVVIEDEGELRLSGLPLPRGQHVELIVLTEPEPRSEPSRVTARQLRQSSLTGLWSDRKDIADSVDYARRLREQAQQRRG